MLSGHSDDPQTPFHIVGDGCEADLNAFFSKPSPSHPAKAVASFPSSEDLLDPASNAVDRLVEGLKARQWISAALLLL